MSAMRLGRPLKTTVDMTTSVFCSEGYTFMFVNGEIVEESYEDFTSPVRVFFDPREIAQVAVSIESPFSTNRAVPMGIAEAVFQMLELGLPEMKQMMLSRIHVIMNKQEELRQFEERLGGKMHNEVAEILTGKQTVLLEQLAKDASVCDEEFFTETPIGFPVDRPSESHRQMETRREANIYAY